MKDEASADNQTVTVIMPAYNAARYIAQSIDSVLAQTYQDWELLVINDCSTDATNEIVLGYIERDAKKRIHLLNNKKNSGVSETRNAGIKKAKGRYIAFLDSDDIWLPEKLALQVPLLSQDDKCICSHGSYIRITPDDEVLGKVLVRKNATYSSLLRSNSIGNLTGIYDTYKCSKILQKPIKHEDYVMWLEILKQDSAFYSAHIAKPIGKYRVMKQSVSSNKLKSVQWHWNILRNELHMGIFKAAYYWIFYLVNGISKRIG